ncbi:MAG TPA: hypothetical protein DCR37_07730 [Glaciecola sp.]|nr:hypothetical protein [Glaciecola sp.]
MKINKPNSQFKHLAVAASVMFALTACGSDNGPVEVEQPPAPPAENNAPVVSSSAVNSAEEAVLYTYTLTATDADAGDNLVLASVTLPSWLTFNATTGVLSGTPSASDVGANNVSLTVSDGTDTVTQDFTITVVAAPVVNTVPVFTSTTLTMGSVGTSYSYTATATDADANDTLSFSSITLPAWAMFNTDTAVLSGTPDIAGDYSVELMVSDGTDTASQTFTIAVAAENAVTVALSVFENTLLPEWAPWINDGGSTTLVTDDVEHDQAVQFNLTAPSVAGFTARDIDGAVNGSLFNASGVTNGVLSFELKMVKAPDAGVVDWKLKLEAGPGSSAEVNLSTALESHATPVLNTWQTYTFPLASLGGNLDLSKLDLFMVFPNYNQAPGAQFLLDNFMISEGSDTVNPNPAPAPSPLPGLGGDTGLVNNGDFELGNLDGWLAAGSNISTELDAEGNWIVKVIAPEAQSPFIGQDRIGEGEITAGQAMTVSFDMRGSVSGDGGVVNALLLTESPAGVSKTDILVTTVPNAEWTRYTYEVTAGNDPEWGVNFRLQPACGAVAGCEVTAYFDNVSITVEGDGSGGGSVDPTPAPSPEPSPLPGVSGDTGLVTNGDFELGSLNGWIVEGANIAAEQDADGNWLAKLVAPEAQNPFIKQDSIGRGVITPGQALTVSFYMRGNAAGDGGVVNALLFSESSAGVSKTDQLASVVPNAEWTKYTFNTTAGSDTEFGLAILLQPVCGAVQGCEVTAYFDEVTITAQ